MKVRKMSDSMKSGLIVLGFFIVVCILLLFMPDKPVEGDLSTEIPVSTEISTELIKSPEIATQVVLKGDIEVDVQVDDDTTDVYYMGEKLQYTKAYNITEDRLFPTTRMVYFNHRAEVWYSVKEETGHTTRWDIPGKHVADDGTIRDKDGYSRNSSR